MMVIDNNILYANGFWSYVEK